MLNITEDSSEDKRDSTLVRRLTVSLEASDNRESKSMAAYVANQNILNSNDKNHKSAKALNQILNSHDSNPIN